MAVVPLIISKSKAFCVFEDLKLSRKDSSLLIIVTKVLHRNKVTPQSKPTDIDCAKSWVTKSETACSAFNRILKNAQKKNLLVIVMIQPFLIHHSTQFLQQSKGQS